MKSMNRKTLIVVSHLVLVALLLVGTAYAAAVNIDTFDTGTQELQVDSATTFVSNVVDGGTGDDVLGRYREAHLSWTSGDANRKVNLKIDTGGTTNDLSFSAEPMAKGAVQIIWDGDQDVNTFSATGLNNANLLNPDNAGIFMVVTSADLTANLKFTGYEDASNYSKLDYTINQADKPITRLDLFFPYANFAATGTGADWSSLGALTLDISGDSALDLVIDYLDSSKDVREYGDLPDENCVDAPDYSAVLDAYHVPKGLTLGSNLDTETTYTASAYAFGDDSSDYDDEDGATPEIWTSDETGNTYWRAQVSVNGCSGTCYLSGWIDRNSDGDFVDTGERFINNTSGTNSTLSKGYSLGLLNSIPKGYYYLRFRVCDVSSECDDPGTSDKVATNGEVEDYRWYLNPTSVDVESFSAGWQGPSVVVDWQTASEVNLTGFNVWRSDDAASHGARLNDVAIPPLTPGSLTGNAYSYPDDTAEPDALYYYWLETEYIGSSSVWYGPIQATSPVRVYLPLVQQSN